MSNKNKAVKVTNPNEGGNKGFIIGLVALLAIIAAVLAYVVWQAKDSKVQDIAKDAVDVSMTMKNEDGIIELSSDKATESTPTVELFEDFSCPHCAELAVATDSEMKQAIEDGKINVHIRPLNFLDGKDFENQTGHSTTATAAMEALSKSGNVKAYWNLRNYLFVHQKDVYKKWDLNNFAEAAKAFGADSQTQDAIKNADVKELGNKVAAANAKELQDETGSLSSPRVIYNDKDLVPDNENINTWIQKAEALNS